MLPVILSGGSGTRLWPLSRKVFPKQFHKVLTDQTLFQMTLDRVSRIASIQSPLVVCNEEHRFIVAEQLRELQIEPKAILLEPVGRNTAPAIAVAAFAASEEDPLLLVLPSDHLILDPKAFVEALECAKEYAESGKLVTFGIIPIRPETDYGYIQVADHPIDSESVAYKIQKFIEKPPTTEAEKYVASGNYYWNSGMFLFKASTYLNKLQQYAPEIYDAAEAAYRGRVEDLDFLRLETEKFAASPSDSIDYAVMEKTEDGVVVPLKAGWSDIGSWTALWETQAKDSSGNVKLGDVVTHQVSNSYLRSESKFLVAVGVEDLIIVDTDDAILVAKRGQNQLVKELVEKLQKLNRPEANEHRKVYRPWGYYDSLHVGDRHQVKRIVVKPGGVLSLQFHHHRAEHWVVVKGTARVTRGEETFRVSENESAYIPLGEVHRLENPGNIPLEMIEVQSGSYLGEDDIVRLEDHYNRAENDDRAATR